MTTVPYAERNRRRTASTRQAFLLATVALALIPAVALAQDAGTGDPSQDLLLPQTDGTAATGAKASKVDPLRAALDADMLKTGSIRAARVLPVAPVARVQGGEVTEQEDPFAAPGITLGNFILRPTLEIGLTGQRKRTTTGSGAPPVFTEAEAGTLFGDSSLRLNLESDWSRNSLIVNAEGSLRRTLTNGDALEPDFSIDATGRLDISGSTTLTSTLAYTFELEDPKSAGFVAATDPSLIPALTGVNDPATQTIEGSLTLRHEIGRLYTEAGVSAVREIYGAAKLSDGSSVSQTDLNNSVIDGRLRAGIEASAVFSPFVEASYGVRRMDRVPDMGGFDRRSVRYGMKAGTGFDLGEKLNGEVAVGYLVENVRDPALDDIAGAVFSAGLNWSPRRGTDVTLDLATTTEAGSANNGAMLYTADLGIAHRLNARLTAEADLGAEYRDSRSDADKTTLNGEVAVTYWFNRFAGMTSRLGYEQKFSPDPTARSRTVTSYVGLRLQR